MRFLVDVEVTGTTTIFLEAFSAVFLTGGAGVGSLVYWAMQLLKALR